MRGFFESWRQSSAERLAARQEELRQAEAGLAAQAAKLTEAYKDLQNVDQDMAAQRQAKERKAEA